MRVKNQYSVNFKSPLHLVRAHGMPMRVVLRHNASEADEHSFFQQFRSLVQEQDLEARLEYCPVDGKAAYRIGRKQVAVARAARDVQYLLRSLGKYR